MSKIKKTTVTYLWNDKGITKKFRNNFWSRYKKKQLIEWLIVNLKGHIIITNFKDGRSEEKTFWPYGNRKVF